MISGAPTAVLVLSLVGCNHLPTIRTVVEPNHSAASREDGQLVRIHIRKWRSQARASGESLGVHDLAFAGGRTSVADFH